MKPTRKFIILSLSLTILTIQTFTSFVSAQGEKSGIDYTLCKEFIESLQKKSGRIPFKFKGNEIKLDKAQQKQLTSVNSQTTGNSNILQTEEIIKDSKNFFTGSQDQRLLTEKYVYELENKNNKQDGFVLKEKVSKENESNPGQSSWEKKIYKFKIKNNKCHLHEVIISDHKGKKSISPKTCRKVKNFLKKKRNLGGCNKEITNSAQKRQLNNILKEGNININKEAKGLEGVVKDKTFAAAVNTVKNCSDHGMDSMVNDDALWNEKSDQVPSNIDLEGGGFNNTSI